MKKQIYMMYSSAYNMGDLLNKDMIEDLFDVEVKRPSMNNCDMIGIGSGLSSVLKSKNDSVFSREFIKRIFKTGPFYVWGTGFMNKPIGKDTGFKYKNVRILSLRGQLTKNRVEKMLGYSLDVPLGDGGLLAERWIGYVPKKHKVGIIPHYKEQDSPIVEKMSSHYEDAVTINLRNDAASVVKQIAECEYILSSSLHGLIVADSYHIPNLHVMFYKYGEKMMGDGYKFSDYYSSYGLEDEPIFIKTEKDMPLLTIIDEKYKVDSQIVEQKKEAIFKAFSSIL